MTEASGAAAVSSGQQILQGIRDGRVPLQVRLFAAQGLLPVSREDLLRIQIMLAADPDEELAEVARTSIREAEPAAVVAWLADSGIAPMELDLLVRVRQEEAIWTAVASHVNVTDKTIRVLAANGSPLVQDVVITNQVRLLRCLELLEDLRSNPQASQVVLRRVREFEEEFIAKAVKNDGIPDVEEGPSMEDALAALKAIGAHIPSEEDLPYPQADEDPGVVAAVEKKGLSAFGKILNMNIKEKIVCGLKGSREDRAILINSRNRLVLRGVLASPKISDIEVERFANSRSVSDEVIRIICQNNKWLRQYPVVLALACNPKTPVKIAIRQLPKLSQRDVTKLAKDRNAKPIVRRRAKEMAESKKR